MSDSDQIQRDMLDGDWTEAKLSEARRILDHLEASPQDRSVLREYDSLRESLRCPDGDAVAPPGGFEALETSWHERRVAAPPAEETSEPRGGTGGLRWWSWPAAMAATIVLAVVGWSIVRLGPRGSDEASRVTPAGTVRFIHSTAEIQQDVRAFEDTQQVYDRRARWVAATSAAADVGLADAPITATDRLLLLRLTMLRGEQLIAQADLTVVPGQEADLTVPSDVGLAVRFRIATTSDEPTRLTMWTDVRVPGGEDQALAALATDLRFKPGTVVTAGQWRTSTGRYRLEVGYSEYRR